MSGGHSVTEPPGSIPNSAVKRNCGDGSVGLPHVRVAHRQTPNVKKGYRKVALFYCVVKLRHCFLSGGMAAFITSNVSVPLSWNIEVQAFDAHKENNFNG